MSFKKVKGLNLVPEKLRYNYVKDRVIKLSAMFLLGFLLLIIFDFFYLNYSNNSLLKTIKKYEVYEKELNKRIVRFGKFENEYKDLREKIKSLETIKNDLKTFYKVDYSTLFGLIDLLDNMKKNMFLKEVNYKEGEMVITGLTLNAKVFYKFYHGLERDKHWRSVKFNYIKKTENGYEFKIVLDMKRLDEIG